MSDPPGPKGRLSHTLVRRAPTSNKPRVRVALLHHRQPVQSGEGPATLLTRLKGRSPVGWQDGGLQTTKRRHQHVSQKHRHCIAKLTPAGLEPAIPGPVGRPDLRVGHHVGCLRDPKAGYHLCAPTSNKPRESRQATERHTGNRKASPATQVASVALSQILVVPISTNAVLVSAMYCVLLFDFLMSALY